MKVLTLEEARRTGSIKHLKATVDDLRLSVRSDNWLSNAGIHTVVELISCPRARLSKTANFGERSMHEVEEILEDLKLGLEYHLSYELKIELGLPATGLEPRENPPKELPPLEVLIARRDRLTWMIEHYDEITAGFDAATVP